MNCRLCSSHIAKSYANAKLFDQMVQYFECHICGYLQTEDPDWLDDAYATAINDSDTGIMSRNLSNVGLVLGTLTVLRARTGLVVDYAAGHGFLVRLLRDKGVNAFYADPYCENLVARGFEYTGAGTASLVAAFEAFEHFVNPVEEMGKLLSISPNILLTTSIAPRPTPKPSDWWYYGLDHGQHIGFYRVETLKYLADQFGLHLITDGVSRHFFSRTKVSYASWVACVRIARRVPGLFAFGLPSKTWSDHLSISQP